MGCCIILVDKLSLLIICVFIVEFLNIIIVEDVRGTYGVSQKISF